MEQNQKKNRSKKSSLAFHIIRNNMILTLVLTLLCLIVVMLIQCRVFINTYNNELLNNLEEYSQKIKKEIETDTFQIDSISWMHLKTEKS